MFTLETPQLILRDMQAKDESAFVTLSQDKKYQRFYDEIDSAPEKYRELTQLFIKQSVEIPRTAYQLAIEHKKTENFMGIACLRLEDNYQASIGGGLARNFQGQRYIQEAMGTLVDFGFKQLDIHRIYAETISKNKPAIRLCQQLGMRQEAYFRENRYFKNRYWDSVVLAILKNEWQNR